MNWPIGCLAALIVTASLGLSPAQAQTGEACPLSSASDPPRAIFVCASGLVIEAEAPDGIDLHLPSVAEGTTSIEITDRAVWIEVAPGGGPFQIATPHAIAAVRGTTFIVDAAPDRTDVFVVEGVVAVSRPDGTDEVTLADGDGVTFADDERTPVRQWLDERVAALLARFAR
ncbi:MAG: FecR domain-containing protein [Dehalococcoidia bacterium]